MDIEQAEGQARIVGLDVIAERCKRDLFFLNKYVLAINPDLITEHTHRDLCEITKPLLPNYDPVNEPTNVRLIERISNGKRDEVMSDQFDPNRNKVLILMPRGTFKSSIVTIGFTLQYILNSPNARILIDSETYSKAKIFLAEIKGHLEGNQKYRAIFKHIHGVYPDDTKKNGSVRWKDNEIDLACRSRPMKEPSITCSGIDRSINGMHFDLIIEDDLHSEKNVTNKEQIQQVIDHRKLAQSLLDPGMPRITVGTRWDYQDAYNYVLTIQRSSYNILIRKAIEDDGTYLFPERLTDEFLEEQKRDQGNFIFYCTPGDGKIWMADGSFKKIADVEIGDTVIGFERTEKGRHHLKPTKVISKNSRQAMVNKIHLASGTVVRSTADHKWFTGRPPTEREPNRKEYKPVEVGSVMVRMAYSEEIDLSIQDKIDWAYLAGIIDGEGACKYGSVQIAQSEVHNAPVCRKIEETLGRLEIGYSTYAQEREGKTKCTIYTLHGGRKLFIDLIRYGKPAKAPQILANIFKNSSRPCLAKDKVISIEEDRVEEVYALGTETGNYVSQSFGSSNCQYFNQVLDDETATFKQSYIRRVDWDLVKDKPTNWFMAVDPSAGGEYADYAAFVLAGMDYQQEIVVRQVYRAKMNYSEIINLMFEWYTRYKPRRIALETIATQKNIQYMLNDEQKRRGVWLPVQEIKTRQATKEDRVKSLAPYYEFGRIVHVKEATHLDDFEYELLHFPKGTHDDMVDALATVLEIATPPTGRRVDRGDSERRSTTKAYDKPRSPVTGI